MRALNLVVSLVVFINHVLVMVNSVSMWEGYAKKRDVECRPEMSRCKYVFIIHEHLTMVDHTTMTYPYKGKLFPYYVENPDNSTAWIDPENVVQADGWDTSRVVYVVNGSLPGPSVEIYEGQTAIIEVHNGMRSESTSIHWHGLNMRTRPWMDGVAFVTQCPILPGQKFTYSFKATQLGTYWWHAHIGAQRTMGLYGALIIRPKPKGAEMQEHIMQLSDWNHDWDSMSSYLRMVAGAFNGRKKMKASDSIEGAHFSMFNFQSGLVNGKGRYYDPDTGEHNGAPIEVFTVKPKSEVKFRVIAAGNLYPFRVSIDGHPLRIVASDGMDLEPVVAESFVINPGERFDFVIKTDNPIDNYWIRAVTLEINVKYHIAESILRYEGASSETEPTSSRSDCTKSKPCLVVNCPFLRYPEEAHTNCLHFGQLKGRNKDKTPSYVYGKFKEHFLNFAFPGEKWTPGSVNGHAFQESGISPLTQPGDFNQSCDHANCGEEKTCLCTLTLAINYGDTVQMVFMNLGRGRGWAHPMHLHGHSFYVLKMGFATYDVKTGKIKEDTTDIDCGGNPDTSLSYCNKARWMNPGWFGDNIPRLNLVNPPRKDTIIVPTGGYVIVRIRADNPGLWIFHCHIEMHSLDGMTMLVAEALDKVPATPRGFPRCHGFEPTDDEINAGFSTAHETRSPDVDRAD